MRHVLLIVANFGSILTPIFKIGIVAMAMGCASTIDIDAWDPDGISQSRTWAFLRHDPPIDLSRDALAPEFTYRVTSPMRDAQHLDADVARCIEEALAARGFERVETDADFYVDYQLTLQPRAETVEVPLGQRFVPSLSFSQSYLIEGLDISERRFEALRFEIDLRERRGRILWRAELLRELETREELVLGRDVDNLIDQLPRARMQ